MKAESESGEPRRGLQRPRLIVRRPRPMFWNPPGLGARPGAAEEGVRPGGSDLRTLRKAPSLLADSVRRRPPSFPSPPQSVPSPAAWGCLPPATHTLQQTLVEPRWLQAGVSPLGLSMLPHTCHPHNLGFNASNEGASRRPQCGQGALEVGYLLSPALTFTQGERYTSQGRQVPQSRHYGCLTECVWHFFFNLLISFTCSPPAHRA